MAFVEDLKRAALRKALKHPNEEGVSYVRSAGDSHQLSCECKHLVEFLFYVSEFRKGEWINKQ